MVIANRPLGLTGIRLSPIGLGTVKIGRNTDLKYPFEFELPSDDEVVELLKTASILGINCLDTAPAYGESEERLGQLLPEIKHDFRIITKVGETYSKKNGSHYDFSENAIMKSLERSISHLNRSHLDVVLLHSDGNDIAHLNTGALDTLIRAREAGLISAVGLSGKTLEGGMLALEMGADCLMITLNSTEQNEAPLIKAAEGHNAGLLIKKPFGSGHLIHSISEVLSALFQHSSVASAIIGTTNPVHLQESCEALPSEIQA